MIEPAPPPPRCLSSAASKEVRQAHHRLHLPRPQILGEGVPDLWPTRPAVRTFVSARPDWETGLIGHLAPPSEAGSLEPLQLIEQADARALLPSLAEDWGIAVGAGRAAVVLGTEAFAGSLVAGGTAGFVGLVEGDGAEEEEEDGRVGPDETGESAGPIAPGRTGETAGLPAEVSAVGTESVGGWPAVAAATADGSVRSSPREAARGQLDFERARPGHLAEGRVLDYSGPLLICEVALSRDPASE
jgi:hypothetical protein